MSTARIEESRRQGVTEREVAAALAETAALCDRGEQEIENPPRWRLTLATARIAHQRAITAVETGPASDEVREKVRAVAARLDRDEVDCGTAEACEKCLIEFLGTVQGPQGAIPQLDGSKLNQQFEGLFERIGMPLRASPDAFATALRAHRLRYQFTALLLIAGNVPPDKSPRLPLLTPQLLAAVKRELHPLLPIMIERATRPHRVGGKELVGFDPEAMLAQFQEGAGKSLTSSEIVCLSLHEVEQQKGFRAQLRLIGLDEIAHRRNPANLFALVLRVASHSGRKSSELRGVPGANGGRIDLVNPLPNSLRLKKDEWRYDDKAEKITPRPFSPPRPVRVPMSFYSGCCAGTVWPTTGTSKRPSDTTTKPSALTRRAYGRSSNSRRRFWKATSGSRPSRPTVRCFGGP